MKVQSIMENRYKKSENDKNGIIGGLIFGGIFLFLTYQIYIHFFNNQIGQVFVYILSFWLLFVLQFR